jgi:putative ABC transport system ATP-binding protein
VKRYEGAGGAFTALKGVNLQIDSGEFVAVIGKSGSGKSTLLNIIAGIDRPTSGEVIVCGAAVHLLPERRIAPWRGRTIGVIFQFFQLLPTLTVIENVMLPMDFCHVFTPRERRERALNLLDKVDVVDHAHKLPKALSGGQQQRVAIARALVTRPEVVFADEPTGALDRRTGRDVLELLREVVDADGHTVVMVTHDPVAAAYADSVILLADGQLAGTLDAPSADEVAEQLAHLGD